VGGCFPNCHPVGQTSAGLISSHTILGLFVVVIGGLILYSALFKGGGKK